MLHQPEPKTFVAIELPSSPAGETTKRRNWLFAMMSRVLKRHRWARQYRQLEALPDHLLRDIGLHRGDIATAQMNLNSGNF